MRNFFDIALEYDLQGDVKHAIEYYKLSIENNEELEDAYLNLIVILIEVTFDYGVSSYLITSKAIKEEDIPNLFHLLENLLNSSIRKFQETNEFKFWQYYINNFYKDFNRKQLIKIIEEKEESIVPYFYLYINDIYNSIPFNHYLNKITQLKNTINKTYTLKNKYIKSLIDSAE